MPGAATAAGALAEVYAFANPALLAEALAIPHPNRLGADNQRLEFLGDAVLQILASEQLYAHYPACDEGRLTAMRMQLVCGRALAARAEALPGFLEALAEANLGHSWPQKAVADALEAYFGAVWCDGGLTAARTLFAQLYGEEALTSVSEATDTTANPKGELIAYAQGRHLPLPRFSLIGREGPGHAPTFHCKVRFCERVTEGRGPSRKAAEAQAAQAMLEALLPQAKKTV